MKKHVLISALLAVVFGVSQAAFADEIHDAVRAGDLAKVKMLVAKDPGVVNEKDARGRTPLHFAGDSGNREIIAFLIASGADVKVTDPDGFTPLHWAASAGQDEAARALIKAGADPNALSARGVSTLESAFFGRHPEAVGTLLEGGLKVETTGEAGRALLHRAASAGFLSLVDYLMVHGADVSSKNDGGGTMLHSAAAGGLTVLVGKLIEDGADVNAADDLGQTPLHLAAAAGRAETSDFLIAKGGDLKAVCRDGRNLLHSAAAGGLVDLMDRLVKARFPIDAPDRYGRTPLLKAAEAGAEGAAEFLLSRGANVMCRDYYQQTPLHEAAFSENLRLMDLLVKHGADVHALNEEDSTALLYISQAGRAEAIDWLLEHGARLDVRNKWNETALSWPLVNGFQELVEKLWPRIEALKNKDLLEKYPLHRAAYNGQAAAAVYLLSKGVPIALEDESGRTPFQRAAQGGSVEIAQMLLDKSAMVGALDPEGSTPLHLAVKKGRTDMVSFLLQKGADPKMKDGQGRTPLDLAGEYSYPAIAGKLQDAGAEPTPGQAPQDVAAQLAKPLKDGQAIVWALGHCGFAVKTRTRLLIFDYFSRGGPRPGKPSLANGFVDPEEIKDQDVTVFVSHAHGDHFDPVILSWRPMIRNIMYIFGWNAGKGERTIDMPAPRASVTLNGMETFTVNCEHNDVPEVAYLVKVDGLSIYHSGDYMGPLDSYQDDMAYLLKKAGTVDLAFIGKFEQAGSLKPRAVFPIHGYNREYMYGAFARQAAEKKLPCRVIIPENKGDRFLLPGSEEKRLTTEQWIEDLEFVVSKLESKHPHLFYKTDKTKFDAIVAESRREIAQSKSDLECYFALRKIVAIIEDGHTGLLEEGIFNLLDLRFPFRVAEFTDGVFITTIEKKNEAFLGSRLIAINGKPIEDILRAIERVVSSDNEFGRRYWALNGISFARILYGLKAIDNLSHMDLELIMGNGEPAKLTLNSIYDDSPIEYTWSQPLHVGPTKGEYVSPAVRLGQKGSLHFKNQGQRIQFYWFEHLVKERTIYFQFNQIMNQPNHAESFAQFSAGMWDYIDQNAENISKFIIDLRYNNGGNGLLILPFLNQIIKRDSINKEGRLFVISGRKTYSAASILMYELAVHTRAIFVGEPDGCGADLFSDSRHAGNLPNSGFPLWIASLQFTNRWPIGNSEYFIPDFPAAFSSHDYFSGVDPAVDFILSGDWRSVAEFAADEGAEAAVAYYRRLKNKYKEYEWWTVLDPAILERSINDKGYVLMQNCDLERAYQVFILNTMFFPSSFNVWDSLGECCYNMKKLDLSLQYYKKSLELNPDNKNAKQIMERIKREQRGG